jgi:hypothetical protein
MAERIALFLSALCAVHCLLTPFVLVGMSIFPALGSASALLDTKWEIIIISSTAILGFYTMWHGYKHHHGKSMPMVLFAVGLCVMILHMAFFPEQSSIGMGLGIMSSIIIVVSQVQNYRFTRQAKCH